MDGIAYVFVRQDDVWLPTGYAGHVGWGFLLASGEYYCGSTENPAKLPVILPGGDNGWWESCGDGELSMFDAMRLRRYNAYKSIAVQNASPDKAHRRAVATRMHGYIALGDNCLDHTAHVLMEYGVQDLPLVATHVMPNSWFAAFPGESQDL